MKKSGILYLIISAFIFSSCGEKISEKDILGVTQYFDSFLFCDYEPQIIKQELEFDFNGDAKHYIKSDIKLQVLQKDKDGNLQPLTGVKVYQNGKEVENQVLTITTSDKSAELGIEFTGEATEGFYNLYLKEYETNFLDEPVKLEDTMYVKKEVIWNPLALYLLIGLIIFVIAVVVWYILSRFILWPSVPFGKVTLDYNDGYGDTVVRMSGKYELILTNNKNMKDSFFSKLLKGSRQYEYNEFWEHPITIKKGYGKKLSITGLKTFSVEGEKIRRETFYIENENGNQVKIETT